MVAPSSLAFNVAAAKPSPLPPNAFYRSVTLNVLATLGVHPLDGRHSGTTGGRYNRPGADPTCYLAGCQTIATFECEQDQLVLRLPTFPLEPRIIFAVIVAGARVLDLTQALVQRTLGVRPDDLVIPSAHWQHQNHLGILSMAQQIGEAVRTSRPDIDGLLVPSWLGGSLLQPNALPRTENLVLFMDRAAPANPRRGGVTIAIQDPTGLLPP